MCYKKFHLYIQSGCKIQALVNVGALFAPKVKGRVSTEACLVLSLARCLP